MRAFIFGFILFIAGLAMPAFAETAFEPGQVWSLHDPDYVSVRVVIDKLETMGDQTIVHISLLDVPVTIPSGDTANVVFAHMPFSEEALRQSVDQLLVAHGEVYADFQGGYDIWKADNGGYFTITVPQGIAIIVKQISDANLPAQPTPTL